MLFADTKYTYHFKQHFFLSIVLIAAFASSAVAQNDTVKSSLHSNQLNPLLLSAFKKTVKPNPNLDYYLKPRNGELICFSLYPLTIAQIEARNREWERRNSKTIGGQLISDIADDIIKNQINTLLYGRKAAPAVVPKF